METISVGNATIATAHVAFQGMSHPHVKEVIETQESEAFRVVLIIQDIIQDPPDHMLPKNRKRCLAVLRY
jgi:hypothetical protein